MVGSGPRVQKLTGKVSHIGKINHETKIVAPDFLGSNLSNRSTNVTMAPNNFCPNIADAARVRLHAAPSRCNNTTDRWEPECKDKKYRDIPIHNTAIVPRGAP